MPLLTIAMADVPAPDAGLGSGITNVSQQISGAFGLAVLSTIAANQTKGLLGAHHGATSALISGYHLAFLVGAATIAGGVALAFLLLRPRPARAKLRLAEASAETSDPSPLPNLEMEQEAA